MLPDEVERIVASHIDDSIEDVSAVGGGCIANSCRIQTARNRYFLKWGTGEVAETFLAEAKGLRVLGEAESPLHIPPVVKVSAAADERPGFLLMEWIESGAKTKTFWERFGRGLAELHRSSADRYGFEEDNFIGSRPQINEWADGWPEFFRNRRLEPQIQMARTNDRWTGRWDKYLNRLYSRLEGWLPETPKPSLLHGDLWSGNVMADQSGTAALIDPAVYYGHREADLAMTELFGGFEHHFYGAYREAWPLESGYEQRRDLYNLYHLINHLNHFGKSYADSVETLLRRYG